MENLTEIKFEDRFLRDPLAINNEVCPECHSIYIKENRCDDCGRLIKIDRLGNPFGPRSFYALKEKYLDSLPCLVKFFPFFEDYSGTKALRYKRELFLRLKAFGEEERLDDLFIIEINDLVRELTLYEKSLLKYSEVLSPIKAIDVVAMLGHIQRLPEYNSPISMFERALDGKIFSIDRTVVVSLVLLVPVMLLLLKITIAFFGR